MGIGIWVEADGEDGVLDDFERLVVRLGEGEEVFAILDVNGRSVSWMPGYYGASYFRPNVPIIRSQYAYGFGFVTR